MRKVPIRRLMGYFILLLMPFGMGLGCIGSIPCKPTPFTAQVRAYFLDFKPGSYWIYRNVQNGDIDSVYFVSEKISPGPTRPECQDESAMVILKGFASDKQFGYYITSWNSTIESNQSDIHLNTDYRIDNTMPIVIGTQKYQKSINMTHCCLVNTPTCYTLGCSTITFRLLNVVFAADVGLVRWEAESYPRFGKVTYELVRSNIVR